MSRGCGKCKSCHVGGRYNATESVTFRRNRREVSSLLERPECAGGCPEVYEGSTAQTSLNVVTGRRYRKRFMATEKRHVHCRMILPIWSSENVR